MSDETLAAAPAAVAEAPATGTEGVTPQVMEGQQTDVQTTEVDAKVAAEIAIKNPEGFPLGQDILAQITEHAKAQGWTSEQAQQYADQVSGSAKAVLAKSMANLQAAQKQWVETIQKDPEIGGQNLERTLNRCKGLMDKIDGTGELREFMNVTGMGNHPVVVKAFERIARYLVPEEQIVTTGKPVGSGQYDPARMYPSMRKN